MRRGGRHRLLIGAALAVVPILQIGPAGCGSEERAFTAEGFIDEMNARGAALALGPEITSESGDAAAYGVTLTDLASSATGEGSSPSGPPKDAAVLVLSDADAARDEFDDCERTTSFTCFRAANIVLRIEDLESADRARITTALESIETVDG